MEGDPGPLGDGRAASLTGAYSLMLNSQALGKGLPEDSGL